MVKRINPQSKKFKPFTTAINGMRLGNAMITSKAAQLNKPIGEKEKQRLLANLHLSTTHLDASKLKKKQIIQSKKTKKFNRRKKSSKKKH